MKTMMLRDKKTGDIIDIIRISEEKVKEYLNKGFEYCAKKFWKEQKNKPTEQSVEEIIE